MKKYVLTLLLTATAGVCLFGQAAPPNRPTDNVQIPAGEYAEVCGTTPEYVYQANLAANPGPSQRQAGPGGPTLQTFTPQGSFPVAQIITCGKFRLYYDDFLHSPADGFNHPTLGAPRRAALCAILTDIQSTFNINVNGVTDFMDIYIEQSWSTSNPATMITYLGAAGPYYNPASGYGTTPGYYPGNFYLHATSGVDPQAGQYDAHLIMNFDKFWNGSGYTTINYWDDHTNTSATCRYDLYSVMLHEIGHQMGFLSSVQEDLSNNAVCGVPNNGFSLFDQHFLYHSTTPCNTVTLQKVVTGVSPTINPAVSSLTNELRSNALWTTNSNVDRNHPVYSGTLDPFYALMKGSLCSHLAGNLLANTAQSQFAPGFQSNYVMGPSIGQGQRKRAWTLAEYRMFLTMGYTLTATFGASTSLNGTDTNSWLLSNNSPAYRTNCTVPMLSYNTPYNFMELMTADFPSFTNNNTNLLPTLSQLTINVASLSNIADAQGDAIRVMPNTLFGIRGVSTNANNHNALVVNASGSQIIYTPEAGFHGRAQFGFYLWDGHERGALRIVTVNVVPGSYTVPAGNELVTNGGYEDGTEMRQRILNPTVEHSSVVDWAYEGVFAGQNLSGSHPHNFTTNWWNLGGGDVMQNPWYACFMGSDPNHGYYGTATADWNLPGFGGIQFPIPTTAVSPNDRYHHFQGQYNYSVLKNPVAACNVYEFECDLNFEKTGFAVGQTILFQLQFVNSVSPTYHTIVHYTLPVYVTITTVAPDTWQHVTVRFQYCGTPSYFMNLLMQGVVASPPPVVTGTGVTSLTGITTVFTPAWYGPLSSPFIDNVSVNQVSPTPALTLNATMVQLTPNCPGPVNLTAIPQSYIPCNASYTWNPGSLSGYTVSTSVAATTTYTVTCTSSSCPQTGTATVTVPVTGAGIPWPKAPTGTQREFWTAVSMHPTGDIIGAGFFSHNITFPGYPTVTSPNGLSQLFVIRYSEGCGSVWMVNLGELVSGSESVPDMVVDASGNIFITGFISTTTTFGAFTLNGPAAYILKLDGNTGNVLAAYSSSVSNSASGRALALDASGNVYMTGQFQTTLQFGSLPVLTSAGGTDVFVVRFPNTLAAPVWSSSFGSASFDYAAGIGLSSTSVLYVGANIGGTMTIGTNTFTNTGASTNDIFIGRFNNATGVYVNSSGRMEGNGSTSCTMNDMIVDAAGNVYFTGTFNTSFTTLTATSNDAFISRWLATSLANSWARKMGGTGSDQGFALSFDGAGNIYATGTYSGTAAFTGFTPSSLSTGTVYVVKLTTANVGSFATTSTNGSPNSASSACIAARTGGNAFVGGSFSGTVTFGSTPITSTATNAYLARVNGSSGAFFRLIDSDEEEETLVQTEEAETRTLVSEVSDSEIQVFPNPTSGEVFLQLATVPENEVQLQIFDSFGKLREVNQTQTSNVIRLDLAGLPSGVYLIRIVNGTTIDYKRVTVIQQ